MSCLFELFFAFITYSVLKFDAPSQRHSTEVYKKEESKCQKYVGKGKSNIHSVPVCAVSSFSKVNPAELVMNVYPS